LQTSGVLEGRIIMPPSRAPASPAAALPERANLEHLKKQAKARHGELKVARPDAALADAQLEIARANGFPSWRALKAAFDRRSADGGLAVGDWLGRPEGGVPVALHIRQENDRLRGQLDVPSLGYFGDPLERFSVMDGRMDFLITTRGVNALYEGQWNAEAGEWRGRFTHDGRTMPLDLRRGVVRAPRVEGLDGLWDGQGEDGVWLTFRITTDEKGTFAWLRSSALPDRWFQVAKIERAGALVTLELKTLRVAGRLDEDDERIDGQLDRQDRDGPISFRRRSPGAPAPWA
jgi:hypothetical protein